MKHTKRSSPEELRRHYELEKSWAQRLKNAARFERRLLYHHVYDELFKEIPSLRAVTQKADKEAWLKPSPQLRWIKPFLTSQTVFLEVGAGNCKFAFEVSQYVRRVYAIEASRTIAEHQNYPANFNLIISDATTIPLPDNSVDIIYSRHLLEHLHPEDALEHLQNSCRVLKPGGCYICLTPNRLFGPYDASKYFDDTATGLHLKEYSATEMLHLFKSIGFRAIRFHIKVLGRIMALPINPMVGYESLLNNLSRSLRRLISGCVLVKSLITVRLIAQKRGC